MTFTTISENSWVQPSPKVTLLPVVVVFTLSNHQFPRWSGYMFLVILDGSHCWKSLSSLGVCQTASYARGKRSPYSGHFDYVFTEYILHAYIYIYIHIIFIISTLYRHRRILPTITGATVVLLHLVPPEQSKTYNIPVFQLVSAAFAFLTA